MPWGMDIEAGISTGGEWHSRQSRECYANWTQVSIGPAANVHMSVPRWSYGRLGSSLTQLVAPMSVLVRKEVHKAFGTVNCAQECVTLPPSPPLETRSEHLAEPSSHDGAFVVALMATLDAETAFQVVLAIAVSCKKGRTNHVPVSFPRRSPHQARSTTVGPVHILSARPLVVQNAVVASAQSR